MTFDSLGPVSFVHLYAKHSPAMGNGNFPFIISKAFYWMNNTNLGNGTQVSSCSSFHFNISLEPIFTWKHLRYSSSHPFFSDGIGVSHNNEVVNPDISVACVPLLSGNQVLENVS